MSPSNSFPDHTGKTTTFKDYYTAKWGKSISHDDQPLLKSKTKLNECLLIPEFCVMTGLTDEIRSDFNIMKDMAGATKKEPQMRLQESAGLIRALKDNPKTVTEINN